MHRNQNVLSFAMRGLSFIALCLAISASAEANIYLAFGFEPTSVTNGTIVQGSLPTSFTNDGIAGHGATAVNGAVPYVVNLQPGGSLTMNVVALIANNDGSHANDGIRGGSFSMDSLPGPSGNLKGNFSPPVLNPALTGFFSQSGVLIDTDGDGDVDIGRNHTPTGTNVVPGSSFTLESVIAPNPYFPDPGNVQSTPGFTKAILGTVTWNLSAAAVSGTTNLELFPYVPLGRVFGFDSDGIRNANFGGVAGAAFGFETWEASTLRRLYWLNGGLVPVGSTSTTAPLVQTNPGILITVPEPGSLALLGLGLIGLVVGICKRCRVNN